MRDIEDYSEKYSKSSFEKWKVFYRRKKILEMIEKYHPKRILEIGCGSEPLFQYVRGGVFTVVEASPDFYENAVRLAKNGGYKAYIIKGFFEEAAVQLSADYDMIICASLLHEVEEPRRFLETVGSICNANTIVNVIVPNANSMHRLLGKEMQILTDVHDLSQNNIDFQQSTVFDRHSLRKIVVESGFEIIGEGAFFVKPFSHKQMYEMMSAGILDEKVLDGLYMLGESMTEFASELYINCKVRNGEVHDK